MWTLIGLAGVLLILLVLWDGFEAILLPRRVTHRYRFLRMFYRGSWKLWRTIALRIRAEKPRHTFYSIFGPLSLLALLASWVIAIILGFALLYWSLGNVLEGVHHRRPFSTYMYFSGDAFFTVGYGDLTPGTHLGRTLAIIEAGMGFGFLALIISYLPVLYQAFSRREGAIALLDARAGSPPSAGQLLLRLARSGNFAAIEALLAEWEHWSADLLESHLSFPVLSYYRSQHDNQSWLAAVTAVLDACALLIVKVKGQSSYQAQLTFAMARHAVVDLALVLKAPAERPRQDRLPAGQLQRLEQMLGEAGLDLYDSSADERLTELRSMYEPFVNALAKRLLFTLPPVVVEDGIADNWQKSSLKQRPPGIGMFPTAAAENDHFE
jgi:hypothetical protein